jgi:ADP-heptose:LPS heptosyltransferase
MTSDFILVIKHGALGDIVIATAGFSAIRARHPNAHIVCLTTRPYASLLSQSPYFNDVWIDEKPRFFDFRKRRQLRAQLTAHRWQWVYDLQTSTRSTAYQWLLKRPWPSISNVSRWSSHPYTDPARHTKHAYENLKIQLEIAGITDVPPPDIRWLKADISAVWEQGMGNKKSPTPESPAPSPPDPSPSDPSIQPLSYALIVAGGAPHRPDKRWPAENYAQLCQTFIQRNITPILIGTKAEEAALNEIAAAVPEAINLCGVTSIAQITTLATQAKLAVGNDTGPMHLIAASGCPSTVLFSHDSNPARSAPVGDHVRSLRESRLSDLTVDRVLASLTDRL